MKMAPMESGSPLRFDIRKKASRHQGIKASRHRGIKGAGEGTQARRHPEETPDGIVVAPVHVRNGLPVRGAMDGVLVCPDRIRDGSPSAPTYASLLAHGSWLMAHGSWLIPHPFPIHQHQFLKKPENYPNIPLTWPMKSRSYRKPNIDQKRGLSYGISNCKAYDEFIRQRQGEPTYEQSHHRGQRPPPGPGNGPEPDREELWQGGDHAPG